MASAVATALVMPALPAWRDAVFTDTDAERLVIGQLLVKPERWALLRVGVEHFHGDPRDAFRLLSKLARPWDISAAVNGALATGLVTASFLATVAGEWFDHPLGLRELEARLEERLLRRRMDVLGEVLIQAARDPAVELTGVVGRVGAELVGLRPS